MPKKVAVSTLNASTIDILNVIRENAPLEYQNQVPKVTSAIDIPKVGQVIYGYPSLANIFVNALINRIALVRVKSATFNNAYAKLKKGYLEFGETVEDVFVGIAKVRTQNTELAEERELKRTLPDVKTAFYAMNWNVQYPVTIQDDDLRTAFLSMDGVQDLIAKVVDAVYTAQEYDEYLLFKYILIKAIANGNAPQEYIANMSPTNAAIAFRGMANRLTLMSNAYNEAGVRTTTPRERQHIFMDANFNAKFDVDVLASAFNMDKANFIGQLELIDDWTTFDNERFAEIRAESDMLEEVSDAELERMSHVVAVLVDEEWFQVYDNLTKFTEKYVASGLYWNYFLNVRKTVAHSPFANIVVFMDDVKHAKGTGVFTVEVTGKEVSEDGTTLTFAINTGTDVGYPVQTVKFLQDEQSTQNGIAVQPYGAVILPPNTGVYKVALDVPFAKYGVTINSDGQTAEDWTITLSNVAVGDTQTYYILETPA